MLGPHLATSPLLWLELLAVQCHELDVDGGRLCLRHDVSDVRLALDVGHEKHKRVLVMAQAFRSTKNVLNILLGSYRELDWLEGRR